MNPLRFETFAGPEIASVAEPLGRLRIEVFREYPYLYEGTPEYEAEYLNTYIRSDRSFLLTVWEADALVGATTCIPLTDETEEVQEPFAKAGYDPDAVFYFGESILLPAYRGMGIGNRFFDAREAHAASFGTYALTCFCAVDRPADHPLRPKDYRPLDAFWTKRGYRMAPELTSIFTWPDLGSTVSTPKTMIYRTRPIQ
jgi:GNAT superfamily N-acetyltransferase